MIFLSILIDINLNNLINNKNMRRNKFPTIAVYNNLNKIYVNKFRLASLLVKKLTVIGTHNNKNIAEKYEFIP